MTNKLELYYPLPLKNVTQPFGENANESYSKDGLKGHTSFDFYVNHGEQARFCVTGLVYSVMNKGNPDPMKYRAVFQLVDCGDIVYEVSYGHLKDIYVVPGLVYKAGDIYGTYGNTGTVYAGGHLVTYQEKINGSTAGTHLHGPQVRMCRKVSQISATKKYIYDGYGIYKYKGSYLEVIDYDNGYNGCVDPSRFWIGAEVKDVEKINAIIEQIKWIQLWLKNFAPAKT